MGMKVLIYLTLLLLWEAIILATMRAILWPI